MSSATESMADSINQVLIKGGVVAMITEIGIVAGEIWHHLDQYGESQLRDMLKGIDRPRDLILMSLGWLAREGHIILKEEASGFVISLRK